MRILSIGLAASLCAITLIFVNTAGYVNMLEYVMQEPSVCSKLETHPLLREIPVYTHLESGERRVHPLSYKYHLYSYIDLNSTWRSLSGEQPVIFVPGSRGYFTNIQWMASYMQTVYRNPYFDYYTVRYNEEASFLSGDVIEMAAEFVCHVVQTLRETYRLHGPPSAGRKRYNRSAILIGHSMGGTIARYVPLIGPCSDRDILTIFTFSGANHRPPTSWDNRMVSLFHWMNTVYRCSDPYFSGGPRSPVDLVNPLVPHLSRGALQQFVSCDRYRDESARVKNLTVIAVAGGRKDVIIESSNLLIDGILGPHRGISLHMNFIPNVASTLDHHAIVSCSWWVQSFSAALIDLQNRGEYNSSTVVDVMKQRFIPPLKDYRKYFYALFYGYTYEEKSRLRVTEPFTFYSLEYTHILPVVCLTMTYFCFLFLLYHQDSTIWELLIPGRILVEFLGKPKYLILPILLWAYRALCIAFDLQSAFAAQIPSVPETLFLFLSGLGFFYMGLVACLLIYFPGFAIHFFLPIVSRFFPHLSLISFACILIYQCFSHSLFKVLLFCPFLLDFFLVVSQFFYASLMFYQPLDRYPLANKFYAAYRFFLIAPQLPRLYNLNMHLRTPLQFLRPSEAVRSLENVFVNSVLSLSYYLLWRYEFIGDLLRDLDVFPMRLLLKPSSGANKNNQDIYHTEPFMTHRKISAVTLATILVAFLSLHYYNYMFVYISVVWFSCLSYAYVERKYPKLLFDLFAQKSSAGN